MMSSFAARVKQRQARKPEPPVIENPRSKMRFCQVSRTGAVTAWLFANEPNALGMRAFDDQFAGKKFTEVEFDYTMAITTVIGKLHMLHTPRDAALRLLKATNIIKIEVLRQLSTIRVYLYPQTGPMEFVSIQLNNVDDETRLRKVFTLVLHILEHCNCAQTDVMINLGCMVPLQEAAPLCGFSRTLPRMYIPHYDHKFEINNLDWQLDGPLQLYDQLQPKTIRYHGRFITPAESFNVFQDIRRKAQEPIQDIASQCDNVELKRMVANLFCALMFCSVPVLILYIFRHTVDFGASFDHKRGH